jgi:hypothetical protein
VRVAGDTVPVPRAPQRGGRVDPPPPREPTVRRLLVAVSGVFAGALGVLAVILVAAWLFALARDAPGPGALVLGVHAAAAVGALALQRVADRNGGWPGTCAALVVVTLVGLVCGLYWWA